MTTLAHMALMFVVPTTVALALAVDILALVGWILRKH
jgi:hypothetical protein